MFHHHKKKNKTAGINNRVFIFLAETVKKHGRNILICGFLLFILSMQAVTASGMPEAGLFDEHTQHDVNDIIATYPHDTLNSTDRMSAEPLAGLAADTENDNLQGGEEVTTLFGTGRHGHADGDETTARFTRPQAVTASGSGDGLYIFDTYNNAVRIIDSAQVSTYFGKSEYIDEYGSPKGYYLDGALEDALLNRPSDGVVNTAGELIFADSGSNTIRFVRSGRVYTLCGTGLPGHRDGARNEARFNSPAAAAIDSDGNIYIADTLNHCIRKIDSSGRVSTVAGVPGQEGMRDGSINEALFRAPSGIAASADGSTIYVADTGNHMIRIIKNGMVTTMAGRALADMTSDDDGDPIGGYQDGMLTEAMFNLPKGLSLAGNILIVADSGNHMIRTVSPQGDVTTAAGTGEPGDADGPAFEAQFNAPEGVYYKNGILYIADTGNNKIKSMPFTQQ